MLMSVFCRVLESKIGNFGAFWDTYYVFCTLAESPGCVEDTVERNRHVWAL